jgi:hypothetical protein
MTNRVQSSSGSEGDGKPALSEHVERDADTVELFGGFLAESAEGLEQVDQILLDAERGSATSEQISALFLERRRGALVTSGRACRSRRSFPAERRAPPSARARERRGAASGTGVSPHGGVSEAREH